MKNTLSPEAIKQLFTEARSHHHWLPDPVTDETLRELYDLTKWGPTAVNANPLRLVFIKSQAEKQKLFPALMGSNVDQVKAAPVTAIIAFDEKFYDKLPELFPAYDVKHLFSNNSPYAHENAFRNSSLQGAYFILAARALGLDVCPMSGFDQKKVDETFLSGTTWRSNFICTLGHGDHSKVYPRGPRLEFTEVAKII